MGHALVAGLCIGIDINCIGNNRNRFFGLIKLIHQLCIQSTASPHDIGRVYGIFFGLMQFAVEHVLA